MGHAELRGQLGADYSLYRPTMHVFDSWLARAGYLLMNAAAQIAPHAAVVSGAASHARSIVDVDMTRDTIAWRDWAATHLHSIPLFHDGAAVEADLRALHPTSS